MRNLTDDMLRAVADKGGMVGLNYAADFLVDKTRYTYCADIARHARYMADKAGVDIVALGSDFDGIETTPVDCKSPADVPKILDELRRRGFTVFDSATNFLFATTDRMPCVEIFEKLRARGILIRHFNAPRISDYLRITIGTPEQMQRFFAALDEILGE